jgi:pimeloyl-ACP methyl ester carboxylesterase
MPLLNDFYCVAPDLPGFGQSAPLAAGATIEAIAGHVVDFLDAIGVDKLHVFGLHSGNKVAAALAARWPDRIERLLIAGMTHSLLVDSSQRNVAMLTYAGRNQELLTDADANAVLFQKLERLWHGPHAADVERIASESMDLIQARLGADAMYPANLAFDLPATLATVCTPTRVVELATTAESHFGLQGPLLAALMSNCTAMAMPGDDRDLLQNRPSELAGVVRSFILG